jgi:hypothetical protein
MGFNDSHFGWRLGRQQLSSTTCANGGGDLHRWQGILKTFDFTMSPADSDGRIFRAEKSF